MDTPLNQTILIVVLFTVFLGLANYYQYRLRDGGGGGGRLRYRRRGPATSSSGDDEGLSPDSPKGLLSRWSIWGSVVALLVCILALFLTWLATLQGALQGAP